MGVILVQILNFVQKMWLFPRCGGYSDGFYSYFKSLGGCFPVTGVIPKQTGSFRHSASCFPVTGVIPTQTQTGTQTDGCFPVTGVIQLFGMNF